MDLSCARPPRGTDQSHSELPLSKNKFHLNLWIPYILENRFLGAQLPTFILLSDFGPFASGSRQGSRQLRLGGSRQVQLGFSWGSRQGSRQTKS